MEPKLYDRHYCPRGCLRWPLEAVVLCLRGERGGKVKVVSTESERRSAVVSALSLATFSSAARLSAVASSVRKRAAMALERRRAVDRSRDTDE
jgi:hypothetical protein